MQKVGAPREKSVVGAWVAAAALRAGAWAAIAPPVAHAQYSVPAATSGSSYHDEQEVSGPDDEGDLCCEVGVSLNFLTTEEPSLGGEEIRFTDIALLRTHFLMPLGGSTEVFSGVDILPKQPSYTDEAVWQGALLGGRHVIMGNEHIGEQLSFWARGSANPALDRNGYVVEGSGAFDSRLELEDHLYWESSLGAAYTRLLLDDTDRRQWLTEVTARLGLSARSGGRSRAAGWLMFGYDYPVAFKPNRAHADPETGRFLDPQPRMNVELGGMIGVTEHVGLFAQYSIIDRGDLEDSATTLPVLNSGFDQQQLIAGFMLWFYSEREPPPSLDVGDDCTRYGDCGE